MSSLRHTCSKLFVTSRTPVSQVKNELVKTHTSTRGFATTPNSPKDLTELARQRVNLEQHIKYLQYLSAITSAWDPVEKANIHMRLMDATEKAVKLKKLEDKIRIAYTIIDMPKITIEKKLEK